MPIENLNFQGINRAISDFSSAGACEELINLRPTTAGLVPVKPFRVQMADVTYDKIFVHKAGAGTNYIAIKKNGNTVYIYRVSESGQIIPNEELSPNPEIDSFSVSGYTNFSFEQVHFAYVGNILLFSVADKADSFFLNLSYTWGGSSYKKNEANIPEISVSLDPGTAQVKEHEYTSRPYSDTSSTDIIADALNTGFSAIQEENSTFCFGPILIALAFKTKDGNILGTYKWMAYDPIPAIMEEDTYYNVSPRTDCLCGNILNSKFYVRLCGTEITLKFSPVSTWNSETSIISRIEVYASRPALHVNPTEFPGTTDVYCTTLPIASYESMELENQLLYLQDSFLINELAELEAGDTKDVKLRFGGSAQTTNKTLEVDAGMTTRYGGLLAYNARFHFYDSVAKTEFGEPSFSYSDTSSTTLTDVFAVYNDGQKDTPAFCGAIVLPYFSNSNSPNIIIAPSIRIKQVVLQQPSSSIYATSVAYPMTESTRYNFSINVGASNPASSQIPMYDSSECESYVTTEEPDAINVTEQYNPFVFRVEHSYLAPGKVLGLQPQLMAVADISIGNAPLDVFTNRGTYALLQGDGKVLYGAFRALSNLVSTSNSAPTESGTFFLAAGGLWCIAGLHAVLISDALSLGPHKFIRECNGYKAICNGVYHVEDSESAVSFEDFTSLGNGAKLSYNRFRDELIISNDSYDYSYVLSLKYRQWFKMTYKLEQDAVGDDIVKIPVSNGVWRVLDLSDEIEEIAPNVPASVLAHLQSRPFSMGYQYIHVHRVVAMIRAALANADKLVVALYGSDDLQNWKLLSYADRADVQFSQIRTPSAARSWRYYTITIGGTTPVDTDFGTVMFDYQPVVRRIG